MPVSAVPPDPDSGPGPAPAPEPVAVPPPAPGAVSGAPSAAEEDRARYPLAMTNGRAERDAYNRADELRLQFNGYRPAAAPEVERGAFLPPTTTAAATAPAAARKRKS
ncbi:MULTISPECIES: hypothetical protein [Actinomadura]|uniref:Uncharacterized protein n=1 Tax=Actinomadura yumaensis TaxID=111807 RepID=A0ABW2CU16_9ACTN|nr:hypothetical protein [Actinomadura sp. J1-007]MWK39570.1 hypothetical protein [Actinomadura sp. J1-007]